MSDLVADTTLDQVAALGDKDALAAFAKATWGREIDRQQPFDTLVEALRTVEARPAKTLDEKPKRSAKPAPAREATHLLNRTTGGWFLRTPLLEQRGDLVACDAGGEPL